MCRHCERIKEDVQDIPVVHAFMTRAAENLSRRLKQRITADDLDVTVTVNRHPAQGPIGYEAGVALVLDLPPL